MSEYLTVNLSLSADEAICLVNPSLVNMDDLITWKPGRLVRCLDVHNAVRFVSPRMDYGLVAGMVSDSY